MAERRCRAFPVDAVRINSLPSFVSRQFIIWLSSLSSLKLLHVKAVCGLLFTPSNYTWISFGRVMFLGRQIFRREASISDPIFTPRAPRTYRSEEEYMRSV